MHTVFKDPVDLLHRLGIQSFTFRHIQIIDDFLKENNLSAEDLLNQLGEWSEDDLKITQAWLVEG